MKIASFDVGIKNMAYCIFSLDNNVTNTNGNDVNENVTNENIIKTEFIAGWNVINLMEMSAPISTEKCNCKLIQKRKNTNIELCGNVAKYAKDDKYYCDKHAKKQTEYIFRLSAHSANKLKQMKMEDLKEIKKLYSNLHGGTKEPNGTKETKHNMLQNIEEFFNERELRPIVKSKQKNTKEVDLIEIGRNMKIKLDGIQEFKGITHVIIENQFSTVASRMKCIQGMLAQYFIMKECENKIQIEFISSANKLKLWKNKDTTKEKENTKINAGYKEHKKDAVFYCKEIMKKNEEMFQNWKGVLDTKKKDDLADCFLMGIWYMYAKSLVPLEKTIDI
jgi:hypothetical protein